MNLEQLGGYKSWADRVFYESLGELADGEIEKERPMLFGSILALLNHVYAMDVAWSHNLTGTAHNMSTRNQMSVEPPTTDMPVFLRSLEAG